jgi:hypothetical protein
MEKTYQPEQIFPGLSLRLTCTILYLIKEAQKWNININAVYHELHVFVTEIVRSLSSRVLRLGVVDPNG